jgi:hypothetical protein
MNAYEFVLALVVLMFILGIIRHKMGIPARSMREMRCGTNDSEETLRLRDEVKQLQERIKVLERITVEQENSLAKEIESLRDR